VIRTARLVLLLGSTLLFCHNVAAAEPVRSTTADVALNPQEFDGKPVALGGCQLGQLPDGPACWVLVKGRHVGVIRLSNLPESTASQAQENCPRAGIGNGQNCLVRVFGWVEAGSHLELRLKDAAIKWPD
jgi:hypothetical protein